MTRETLRRWISGYEAAADVDRLELLDNPHSPEDALEHVIPLVQFAMDLRGWPLLEDPVSVRELVSSRDAWDKLRRCWVQP